MLQGLHHLNKRNQKILELTKNLDMHENTEGYTGIGKEFGIDLKGFNKAERSIVRNKLKRFKNLQTKYSSLLTQYSSRYGGLMQKFINLDSGDPTKENDKGVVHNCKVKCNQNNTNAQSIFACEVGCDLKGPYLLDCKNTYKGNKKTIVKKLFIKINVIQQKENLSYLINII